MQTVVAYYRNLTRWDVKSFLLADTIGAHHIRLSSLVVKQQRQWNGTDNFPMLSLHFGGIFSQRESNQIKGKLFIADKGNLVYSKIDLRNGAIGIIPDDFPHALFTAEFPIYEINTSVIHPTYLQMYLQSVPFKNLVNSIVSGASGRKRVKPSDFEDLFVYIPSFTVQEKIVSDWRNAQKEARELKHLADKKEKAKDDYILSALGIEKKLYENKKGPFVLRFKELDRWDTYFYRQDFFVLEKQIEKTKFGYLGKKALFTSRGWSRKHFPSGIFRYVQISDVNKEDGIINSVNIAINEAPSRATQIIKEGDIIISTTRPYLAAFAKVSKKFDGCIASSGFSVIEKTTVDLDKDYLLAFLKSRVGLKQIEQRMAGASYPAITQDELEKIKIPLPPLKIQKEIAKKVESMRQEISQARNQADEILKTAKVKIGGMLKA